MDDNTLTDMQEMLAHHERQISDLNDVIIDQGKQIHELNVLIKHLKSKITSLEDTARGDGSPLSVSEQAARDKPPHY